MGSEGSSISNAQETNVKKEGKEKAERSRIPRVAIEDITDLDVHGPVGTNQHAARGTFHQRARHRREHGTLTRWDPSGEVRSDSRESHGRWSSSAGDRSWRVGEEREPLMEEKRVRPTRFRTRSASVARGASTAGSGPCALAHPRSSWYRSFYSECCRSFVPDNLTAFMAYHIIVPFRHACHPCELGNLNGIRVNSTEQEPGDCDVARADLIEQELENCDVARADLTERELGNCDVARVDPTEQELENCDAARVDPTEQEPGNCDVARVDPTERELGNCDVRLLPRVSLGANPGVWPRG
ncbi:hypothetical protein BHM03_00049443 [Ensete ventricosum]|nr:hypothetical protein BHM03_00049443 [Ensete ventricosum]